MMIGDGLMVSRHESPSYDYSCIIFFFEIFFFPYKVTKITIQMNYSLDFVPLFRILSFFFNVD